MHEYQGHDLDSSADYYYPVDEVDAHIAELELSHSVTVAALKDELIKAHQAIHRMKIEAMAMDKSLLQLTASVEAKTQTQTLIELRDSFNAACNRRDELAARIAELEQANNILRDELNKDENVMSVDQQRIAELEQALNALAEQWDVQIAVAYNEYSAGQRAAFEQAAAEIRTLMEG